MQRQLEVVAGVGDLLAAQAVAGVPAVAVDGLVAAVGGSGGTIQPINIILKENDSGGSAETSFGRYGAGDGDTVHQTVNYGLSLPNDGFANLALDSKEQEPFNRTGSATGRLYGPLCVDAVGVGRVRVAGQGRDLIGAVVAGDLGGFHVAGGGERVELEVVLQRVGRNTRSKPATMRPIRRATISGLSFSAPNACASAVSTGSTLTGTDTCWPLTTPPEVKVDEA